MTMTLLEILDSVVKIGLGAAITAFATYKSNKLNHLNDRNKDIRAHKIKTLELIADRCDAYFVAYRKLHNRLEGIRKRMDTADEVSLNEAQQKTIKECDTELNSTFDAASSARARLRLLQAIDAEAILGEIGAGIAEYRNKVMFEKVLPSAEMAKKYSDDFVMLRRSFDKELSKFYANV
ncbi:hypothetical protein [Undibacterium aquatile]|uniref:Uncharacterized protein n=1 Tax=Undibacterium aquatile TaxID=1537398 RepID=A0ABR6XCA1_9BURK|nr:hypothetical protein [Undibacterium aquatile]MBC3810205.1 hypothetical protein [Undibacterium aquatile]